VHPASPTYSCRRFLIRRDQFIPSMQVKYVQAEDIYTDHQLLSLLQTRAWDNGLYWHILPPPAIRQNNRCGYNIVSKLNHRIIAATTALKVFHIDSYLKVSLYKLVCLFPCSKNLRNYHPEWMRSSICAAVSTKAMTHPMDFRWQFYHALTLRRKRRVRISKKIPDDSGKTSRESNASLVSD
jgi:hypothetical protein